MTQPIPKKIGKYELIEQLGQGGMGIVYKARDPFLNRVVAIKMLAIGFGDNPEFQKRFYHEAVATATLNHPNIVTIYDLGDHEGRPYLVMEYIEGRTLDSVISRRQSLLQAPELAIALGFVIDVCSGLDYGHRRGVVHRDIKPSNIMLMKNGTAKIVDFGIARLDDGNLTRTGAMVGSLNYMSPEQVQGRPVDQRSDVFSTGVVLYQLLTGHSPFARDGDFETMTAVLQESPPSFDQFLSAYHSELETITFKALAKNPEDRYQTAADMAVALSRLRDSGPLKYVVRQPPVAPAEPPTPQPAAQGEFASIWQAPPGEVPGAPLVPPPSATKVGSFTQFLRPSTRTLASDYAAAIEERRAALPSDATFVFSPAAAAVQGVLAMPRVQLTFTAGNDGLLLGKSVVVSSVPYHIGRNADLSIRDVHLTQKHAVIDWDGKAFTIADLGSRNGTYVNGRQLRTGSQVLPFGAVIRLGGSTVLTFSSDEINELPDLTGQTITNRYQLTKLLRNGTKTALYEASDSHLPQKVAIKILSPSLALYGGYLEQFNREAQVAVALRHPHICRVLDFGQTEVRIGSLTSAVNYLSMELMEGGSLTDRVAAGTLEVSQVLSWMNQISAALECAHRQGVTHGGLKLSSIVFDREGEPYVTDFAMACRVDDQAKLVFVNSPEFLAPEQWDGATPTPLADQYAMAVLAYFLLTGSLPFEGQMDPKVRERNFLRGPVPAHEEATRLSRAGVPPGISQVLKRALSVDPKDRYSSVRDFFAALQSALTRTTNRSDGPARIFISYQRDSSSGWAVLFAKELQQKHQIAAFVDTQRMDSAVRFPDRLKRAIQDCDVFVCLLSSSTLQSKWVREEIRLAWENNKPMLPVFQESYALPDPSERLEAHVEALINYDGVKLLDRQNLYVENAIEKLAEMVTDSVRKSGRGE